MLTSVVLQLRPVAETRLPISHGSFVHAAAQELLIRMDPKLGHAFHEANTRKPLTCSLLQGLNRREGRDWILSPERSCSWRFTGMIPEISRHLLGITPELGGIRIGQAIFHIEGVATTPEDHPEAAQDTFETLLAHWEEHPPPRTVTLKFLTATTFRTGRFEQPFPLPRLVFGSLLSTWNEFAPLPLQGFQEALESQVALSNWKGETRRVELGSHRTVGFIGKFTYRSIPATPELSRLLGLLGSFSWYAGVGWQTTHGLGQARSSCTLK